MQSTETVTQTQPKEIDLGSSKPRYFNGISDKIDIPYNRDFNPASFTVEMWVQYMGGNRYQAIVTSACGSDIQGRQGYLFCLNPLQQWQFWLGSGRRGAFWIVIGGSRAELGKWTHLAGSYNAESQTVSFYINGVAVGQKTGVVYEPNDRNSLHLAAGATEQPGASPCYFYGSMTRIRVWNHALSPTKVKNISDEGLPIGGQKEENGKQTGEEKVTAKYTLSLNRDKDYVEVPYSDAINPEQFTVFCWAKVEGGKGQWRSAITSRDNAPLSGYILYAGNNNCWQFWVGDGRGWVQTDNSPIEDNAWTALTATYDGSRMRFYINGELVGERGAKYVVNSRQNLRIGAGITEGEPGFFFVGNITEVRIWNRARTQEEIKRDLHRRLKGDEEGLVYYSPLNAGSGDIVEDKTSKGNHGKIYGTVWEESEWPLTDENGTTGTDDGTDATGDGTDEGREQPTGEFQETPKEPTYPPQPVLNFDGENDFVNLGKQPNLKIGKEITIETWVYIEPLQEWPNSGIVSNFDENNSDRSGYGLLIDDNHGIDFILNLSSNNQIRYTYINSGGIEGSKWHHVAGTYNGEVMKIYVDGVETKSQAASSTGINYNPESDLRLGIYEFDDENYYFQGKIAEVRVWNIARSQEDIQKDMHRRLEGSEAGLVAYWPANEGSGDTVYDKTENGHNGTIHGATWQPEEKKTT